MPLPLDPVLKARLVHWNQPKGYGFLAVGEEELFLHRRDLDSPGRLPQVGDVIEFTVGSDRRGRPCACKATFADRKVIRGPGRPRGVLVAFMLLPALLFLPVWAASRLGVPPRWIFVHVVGLSLFTHWMYARDKRKAQEGEWRISELRLHLLELLGGWPGALIAQRHLRHKSSKMSYLLLFWLIVAGYQIAAWDALHQWRWTKAAVARVQATSTYPDRN